MGSNLLSSSSKRSSIKIGSSHKHDKSDDLAESAVLRMDDDSDSEDESVDDVCASGDETDSSQEDDNQNAASGGDSEDDGSGMEEVEEQNDNMSDSSDDENEFRTMKDGDGVDFSDSDVHESEVDEGEEGSDIRVAANPAWAQAMAKILRTQKPSGKKAVALSKAKTIPAAEAAAVQKQEEQPDFEIVGEKEVKSHIKTEDVKPSAEELLQAKRVRLAGCRVKQDGFDYNRERALTKIATKGVVQLFNAVRAQQKNLGSKLAEAHSMRMEEKLLKSIDKNSFLEHLTGKIRSRPVEEVSNPAKKEEGEIVLPKSWNELSQKVESNSWDKVIEIKDEPDE